MRPLFMGGMQAQGASRCELVQKIGAAVDEPIEAPTPAPVRQSLRKRHVSRVAQAGVCVMTG